MRNLVDDVRVSLEVIRLKKSLKRDDVSPNCGRAVVRSEDGLTLEGKVGSIAKEINMSRMRMKFNLHAKNALGRRDRNRLNGLNGYCDVFCCNAV